MKKKRLSIKDATITAVCYTHFVQLLFTGYGSSYTYNQVYRYLGKDILKPFYNHWMFSKGCLINK
jgi:hypothetical protein